MFHSRPRERPVIARTINLADCKYLNIQALGGRRRVKSWNSSTNCASLITAQCKIASFLIKYFCLLDRTFLMCGADHFIRVAGVNAKHLEV